jgi:hypothetical protein
VAARRYGVVLATAAASPATRCRTCLLTFPLIGIGGPGRDSVSVGAFDDAVWEGRMERRTAPPRLPQRRVAALPTTTAAAAPNEEAEEEDECRSREDDDGVCASLRCALASKRRRNDSALSTSGPLARPANHHVTGGMVNCVRLRWRRGGRPQHPARSIPVRAPHDALGVAN